MPTELEEQADGKAAAQTPVARKAFSGKVFRGRKKAARVRPTHCLNCGAATTGNFCAECGQENEDQTVAVKLLVGDFLSDLASFDSRLLRTLVPLVIRPGFLTNEYNIGRRVRYLSPFKLYLTLSVLFFVVLPLVRHDSLVNFQPDAAQATAGKALQNTDAQMKSVSTQINNDEDLKEAKADLKDAVPGLHAPALHTPDLHTPDLHKGATLSVGHETYDLTHLPPTVAAYDAQQRDPRRHHNSPLMQHILRQVIKIKQNPAALSAALLDYIPKMMFVLLPAFALSLKLVYLRSKRLYIEHLIFSLHLHAFIFLLLTLLLVVQAARPQAAAVTPVAVAVALLYPFIAMRVVYKQGWGKTFLKYNLLAVNYLFLLTFTLLGALAIAFLLI